MGVPLCMQVSFQLVSIIVSSNVCYFPIKGERILFENALAVGVALYVRPDLCLSVKQLALAYSIL